MTQDHSPQESAATALPLGYRIGRLLDVNRGKGESMQTDADVAAGVADILGCAVSPQLIAALRADATADPEEPVLSALAQHFAAPDEYLLGTPQQQHVVDHNLDIYLLLRHADMPMIGLRTRRDGLSEETVAGLSELISDVHTRYSSAATPPALT